MTDDRNHDRNAKEAAKERERKLHVTVPSPGNSADHYGDEDRYVDENLRTLQNIGGGGPPRKADLGSMPGFPRIVGYFVIYAVPLLFLILILISYLK
ncbi:hypothetical protein [Paenibacillus dakarensis]|uniref:hypothetical protein n=1 Tax=Paenibacillus dakarensis TaxID=1527293 RepID=UPI0006D58EC3|nr:hypothetical protein [Paenibacillus dakarensis]